MSNPFAANVIAQDRPGFLPVGAPTPIRPSKVASRSRSLAFRIVKMPLLARYAVGWRWPRGVDAAPWERVAFASGSGATLAGCYAAACGERKGVVVCVHPLRKDAKGFFLSSGRAEALRRNGYDVLLFDLNGFGQSTHGDFRYDRDVLAAADFACARAPQLPVHALSACFGSVWTLSAATGKHPFSGIVVEAPLTSMQEYYARTPLARAFFELLWRVFPRSAAKAAPMSLVAALSGDVRLLMIGGVEDTIAPITMTRRLYEACTLPLPKRQLWYVDWAKHLRAFEAAPHEYAQRVSDFLAVAGERILAR